MESRNSKAQKGGDFVSLQPKRGNNIKGRMVGEWVEPFKNILGGKKSEEDGEHGGKPVRDHGNSK